MKGQSEITSPLYGRSPFFTFLQGAIPFIGIAVAGSLISAVVGLWVYTNAGAIATRDERFLAVALPGVIISIAIGYIVARHTLAVEAERSRETTLGLLKKYRRTTAAPAGNDSEAGQYHIGERYLRDLLGRRGA
jgi:hypothetical protein